MELIAMNEKLEELGEVGLFSSLLWNRKYYEPGSFELHCDMGYFELLDSAFYLYRKGDKLAFIEHIEKVQSETGEVSCMVLGRFIEAVLNDRALPSKQQFSGTPEAICRKLVNDNLVNPKDKKRAFDRLFLGEAMSGGNSVDISTENDYVGDVTYSLLKEDECSQSIDYDYLKNRLTYRVWKGKDRTEDQTTNGWALFSDDLENVTRNTYSRDDSDHKNYAYIVGKDGVTVEVDKVTSGRRKELVVSAYESDRERLKSEGHIQLGRNKIVEIFDGELDINANLKYREDFDLGDLCMFKDTTIGKIAYKRITEVKEVYEDGEIKILPKFGDDYITINQKLKREVNR